MSTVKIALIAYFACIAICSASSELVACIAAICGAIPIGLAAIVED